MSKNVDIVAVICSHRVSHKSQHDYRCTVDNCKMRTSRFTAIQVSWGYDAVSLSVADVSKESSIPRRTAVIFFILYYDQQIHNYLTNYHIPTCFDNIVSSSDGMQSIPCQVTQVLQTQLLIIQFTIKISHIGFMQVLTL
jgi:hypothetical protein